MWWYLDRKGRKLTHVRSDICMRFWIRGRNNGKQKANTQTAQVQNIEVKSVHLCNFTRVTQFGYFHVSYTLHCMCKLMFISFVGTGPRSGSLTMTRKKKTSYNIADPGSCKGKNVVLHQWWDPICESVSSLPPACIITHKDVLFSFSLYKALRSLTDPRRRRLLTADPVVWQRQNKLQIVGLCNQEGRKLGFLFLFFGLTHTD